MTIIAAVLSIAVFYFLFAFGSEVVKKVVGKKICAICAAVSLTWLGLLLLKLLGVQVDLLVIAILMGQSVVGLMTKLEEYFEKKTLKKFWLVRILIITGGTHFVYWFLKEVYFMVFLVLLAGVLLLPFVLPMVLKMHLKNILKK